MNKEHIVAALQKQSSARLRELLLVAYDEMDTKQRLKVFGSFAPPVKPAKSAKDSGQKLLKEIETFRQQSLAGAYYAPFNINSKNWTYVPEKTREWFDRIGELLEAAAQLAEPG